MGWTAETTELATLEPQARQRIEAAHPVTVPPGAVLFRPGEAVKGYVIVLSGRVGVHLVGPTGREILLYEVSPGQSCIQSTLGLLGGDENYTAEAVAESETRLVLVPRAAFLDLIDISPAFRSLVFAAFAGRMQHMMQLVERVAFQGIDTRLARLLLSRADADGVVAATQAEIAAAIGSAREVISRKLEAWAKAGLIETGRGRVRLVDPAALRRMGPL